MPFQMEDSIKFLNLKIGIPEPLLIDFEPLETQQASDEVQFKSVQSTELVGGQPKSIGLSNKL